MLRLYRGITVSDWDVDNVIRSIKEKGLAGSEGSWSFQIPNIQETRDYINQENLLTHTVNDLENEGVFNNANLKGVCAGGDVSTAEYYAYKHNFSEEQGKTSPILIEFEAPVNNIYVDGRDFLYRAFQMFDREPGSDSEKQKEILKDLFGENILKYFSFALSASDQKQRIFLCDLACFDEGVVRAHYNNKIRIYGRSNTSFTSAFFVQVPVKPSQIKGVSLLPSGGAGPKGIVTSMDFERFHNAGVIPDRL